MRILFVADGRSPIALNWIRYFVDCGDEVHLASTFPCRPELALASLSIVPVAFSQSAGAVWQAASSGGRGLCIDDSLACLSAARPQAGHVERTHRIPPSSIDLMQAPSDSPARGHSGTLTFRHRNAMTSLTEGLSRSD